ncbi:Downstream target of A 2 [Hibiscus syriacus]|uniref:Downstream target of A 2 n=1 Tax=Hibiscus syriacus TaxID=106335 RepID=A0A6A3AK86_HIBSY|nr:O-glucosyltransferase rumi homolog [Hibiscus syriacus]KAE8703685.1 Downstream target of A 2 [Hibiscus syriacus]
MGEAAKLFAGFWPYGDQQIHGCLHKKVGIGRLHGLVSTTTFIFLVSFLLIATFLNWMQIPIIQGSPLTNMSLLPTRNTKKHYERVEVPLNCSKAALQGRKCPDNYPRVFEPEESSTETCPDYFRWIHHDLQQWKTTGITQDMIERGKPSAHFRIVIVGGNVYVEKYSKPFQTRDLFTKWGILQLLRLYPGKVPDLDLLFFSGDKTQIMKRDYHGPNATFPPPVFHYCGSEEALDIVFPDWTFWGWAEVKIMPWEDTLRAIKKGLKRLKWEEREPYAFWKGNPYVAEDRLDLMKCNLSDKYDWNVRLYHQNWSKATQEGFKGSKLEEQCHYRYKIYTEGATWSVSEKYIMACDSMTLMIKPEFHDFFSRSLVPMEHYWPIRRKDKCRGLKFAVEWGNSHSQRAQAIGKAGSKFIQELLTMRNVYDYMFHLLNEYSKLLKFKPTVPPKARRICVESLGCPHTDLKREFMEQSTVKSPSNKLPCELPPPFEPQVIQASLENKEKMAKQVETWETVYWNKLNDNKQ